MLNQVLKFHIACDMTAQEVHELGQAEVLRIRSRMDEVSTLCGVKILDFLILLASQLVPRPSVELFMRRTKL